MKTLASLKAEGKSMTGRVSLVLLWLIGVPVPILVIIFLFRGCSG